MYTIKKAEFMLCAAWSSQWPDESLPEVVMAGRSNVGKSSFINTVTNVQGLTKVSSTPGKTRTLNFFNINDEIRLVDVPGYGYAKVPKKMLEQFSEMIDNYLRNRKNLKAMILIVDYRHKPKDDDVTMYDYAKHFGIPVIVVATKEDKLKRNELVKNEKLIKETLDLKSASDDDRAMMEQLPVHHALVRVPLDDRGNHLKQVEVLHIEDYKTQECLIDQLNEMVKKAPRYDENNPSVYIDKRPMIIDGASYSTFSAKKDEMFEYLRKHKDSLDNDEAVLFLGEPRRLLQLYPVTMNNGFCENVLIVAPIIEKMATVSVIMSIAESLEFAHKDIDVWSTKKNEVYRQAFIESQQKVNHIFNELGDICSQISSIKSQIENKVESEKYIFILGTETLLMDMSYQNEIGDRKNGRSFSNSGLSSTIEKRALGEMDLNTLLASIKGGKNQNQDSISENNLHQVSMADRELCGSTEYDARADLKFIMTQGPRLGYHFVILFNTVGELNQSKVDTTLFRHKILFRMAKSDAAGVIGSASANVVAELENHSFRYSNGIEALSFRPYLHHGLSWDGWSMSGETALNSDDEEEYLM